MPGFIAAWGCWWAASLLFAGTVSADEIALACVCGLAAALWSLRLRRAAEIRFRFEPAVFAVAGRAVASLPRAVAKVAACLLRRQGGTVVRQPFVHGRERFAPDSARRAVALLAVSLTPDRFALRLPEGCDEIEIHSLVAPESARDARWLA